MRDSVAIIDADGKILKRSSAVLPIYSITKTMLAAMALDLGIELDHPIVNWFPGDAFAHLDRARYFHPRLCVKRMDVCLWDTMRITLAAPHAPHVGNL